MDFKKYDAIARGHHQIMKSKGFWDNTDITNGERMMLVISEIGEAAEEVRSGKPNIYFIDHKGEQHIPSALTYEAFLAPYGDGMKPCKPEGMIVELVDVGLRLLDLMEYLELLPSVFSSWSHILSSDFLPGMKPLEHFRKLSEWAARGEPEVAACNAWTALLHCVTAMGVRREFDLMLGVKMEFNSTREKLHGKKF